jgi:hypothetical protein
MMFAICCCHSCGLVFLLPSHILLELMAARSLTDLGFTSHAIDGCKLTMCSSYLIDCHHSSNLSTHWFTWSIAILARYLPSVISFLPFCNKFLFPSLQVLVHIVLAIIVCLAESICKNQVNKPLAHISVLYGLLIWNTFWVLDICTSNGCNKKFILHPCFLGFKLR